MTIKLTKGIMGGIRRIPYRDRQGRFCKKPRYHSPIFYIGALGFKMIDEILKAKIYEV